MIKAGDRAPKFPFNRTDYVHVGEEIILREGSNLKGSRGLMPISAHLIQSYVNAIDESKRKYAAENNIECNLEDKTEDKAEEKAEDKAEDNIEDKADDNTEDNTENTTEENIEDKTEEKTEIIPEVVETNDISVENEPGESLENKPIPESEDVSEDPIDPSINHTNSSSAENVTEEETTVPCIRSSLIDVPILL